MASGQQPAVQTFVLRVTIHCHGCKKKVRKVLKSIEGVQDVKVDAQLHKVMVTGTVDAETLVKRLHKSGKQALPWQHTPAKNPEAAPAPAEDGSKDAAVADKKPAEPQADSWDKKPEQETAPEKKPEAEKEAEPEKKAEKEEAKPSDKSKKDGGEGEPKENGTEPAAAAKEASNDESEAKKKQSKLKDGAAVDRSLSPAPAHVPRHAHQEFNPYNAPQPVMSYNMAQPRPSVSYYAPQPEQGYSYSQQQAGYSSMMQQQHQQPPAQQAYSQQAQPMQQWSPSYLYMPYPHASPESYYQDLYSPPGTHASPPLQDSYRLFDDENPNSCSVM